MEKLWSKYNLVDLASLIILIILFLVPFQGFLPVWLSSLFGHYTLFRLWKEFLLVVILLISLYYLFFDQKIKKTVLKNKLTWLIILFLLAEVVYAFIAYQQKTVSTKALFFGLLLDCRYFIFFGVVWIISLKNKTLISLVPKIILYPALIVVGFGLLQIFVLPNNFLAHFGYNSSTILPFQTINNNSKYVRILSTLRGSNPLGAYLIIPITYLGLLLFKKIKKFPKINLNLVIFLIGSLVVLVFSFSRSAWIGAFLSILLIVLLSLESAQAKKRLLLLGLVLLIILGFVVFIERHNPKIQNLFFHTQNHSASSISSDQAHLNSTISNLKELIHRPLGGGPGISGPASIYNKYHSAMIPEDYYLQIGQEVGVFGLIIYLAINFTILIKLYKNRKNTLHLMLFCSLIGIMVVNLFLMAWTDDTLAYLWWGILGMSYPSLSNKLNKEKV